MSYLEDLNLLENELEGHPLDGLEELSSLLDWQYKRIEQNIAIVTVQGQFQTYSINLIWNEQSNSLLMETALNIAFDDVSEGYIPSTLMDINTRLWLGHFVYSEQRKVTFKHTLLTAYLEHIEQLIHTTRTECDRFYTIFFMIQKCDVNDKDKIFLALTDSEGKA